MPRKNRIDPSELPYRPCVGIVLINQHGLVWSGLRIAEPDSEEAGSDKRWQMPQGGIDQGEDPLKAAKRELYEETGIRSVSLLAEASRWITYDLPPHLLGIAFKGRFRGQTQRWFAFRFTGPDNEIAIDQPPDGHKAEFEAWAWKRLDELPDLIVPFKRHVYLEVLSEFRHLVQATAANS